MIGLVVACAPQDPVARGRALVADKGCTGCHVIPGASPPYGNSGPSLERFAAQATIAGVAPNTPANLRVWIREPQSLKPGTTMPGLRLSDAEADAIVAFLQTLR
ncbi:MAG: c-type cytochrome [Dehalococcoidia bacterium]|nr:c-type cytochrome [Dehalococcoidia bacterium]